MAFRWTRGAGTVGLSQFGGGSNMQSSALAISRDGSTVVGVGHPSLTGAVRWAADGSAGVIGILPGNASGLAEAVSDDGRVVAGTRFSDSGVQQAFRWTATEGMSSLGGSDFVESRSRAVSGDGRVIVGCATTASGKVAFIWDAAHGTRSLQSALQADHGNAIEGWQLTCASAISANARVLAGYGSNPQGRMEAWVVELPG
jgi:probable HAF family extracellular repeat protein